MAGRQETVAFGLGEGEVHVHFSEPGSTEGIGWLFPDYRKAEPDEGECRERIRVTPVDGGHRVRAPARLMEGRHSAAPTSGEGPATVTARDPIELLTILEGILARALLETASERIHLHASGVRLDDEALLALGAGGAGKSSLALAWSVMGLPVLGDDVVLVDVDGRAESFRRLFKVDPTRLASHGIDPASTPAWADGSEEAWFDPGKAGGWSTGPIPVRGVVVLDRRSGEQSRGGRAVSRTKPDETAEVAQVTQVAEMPELALLEPPRALNELLASVIGTGLSEGESVDPLLALLDGCDAHRLSFASSAEAARRLVEIFRVGS